MFSKHRGGMPERGNSPDKRPFGDAADWEASTICTCSGDAIARRLRSACPGTLGPAFGKGARNQQRSAVILPDDGDDASDASDAVGCRAFRQRVDMHGIATALGPAERRVTAVKREVDEIDDALEVQPDRRPTIELVFEPADRVAEQKRHFIDAQTVPGPPCAER
jgi:hypothetical protein